MAVFESIKAAMNATGAGDTQIGKVCRGEAKVAGGHKWMFLGG